MRELVVKFPHETKPMHIPYKTVINGPTDTTREIDIIDANDRVLTINLANAHWYYFADDLKKKSEVLSKISDHIADLIMSGASMNDIQDAIEDSKAVIDSFKLTQEDK